MDAFTRAMFEAALFSETGDDDQPLDKNHDVSDFAPRVRKALEAEAERFQEEHAHDIDSRSSSQAGHDFWLTRNGHGAGFWDGDWPDDVGERLTKASKKYGQVDLYLGDDGKIWASGYEGGKRGESKLNGARKKEKYKRPSEEDIRNEAVIGESRRGYVLGIEAKPIGVYPSIDEAVIAYNEWSDQNGVYLNLYSINDHGNVSLLDSEGNELASWV